MRLILISCIMLVAAQSTAQNITGENRQIQLPDCVYVSNGRLMLKKGYGAVVSQDQTRAEVRKKPGRKGQGYFICVAEDPGKQCSVTVRKQQLVCTGASVCSFVTVIDELRYIINLQDGSIQLHPRQKL